jgi:AI-2 transport protein TqsA
MGNPEEQAAIPEPAVEERRGSWKDQATLTTVALSLIIAAVSWYLLKEWVTLLRPLFLSIFLCNVIVPTHLWLKQRISGPASIIVLAGGSIASLLLIASIMFSSAVELNRELPDFIRRAESMIEHGKDFYREHRPAWLAGDIGDAAVGQAQAAQLLKTAAGVLASVAADVVTEAVLVGIYLIFLLIEASRIPERVQSSFTDERSEQILVVVKRIAEAMASYLRVKVKASLVLALPVTLLLWAFGVKFAGMWGVLTFLLNFIPYIGSVIACTGPILLAFLQMDTYWQPISVSILLVGMHTLSAYVIEPSMTGKAVNLSPLFILIALAFWGLCWGVIGMLLAVPLTVMLKIILENVGITRPFARLVSEE